MVAYGDNKLVIPVPDTVPEHVRDCKILAPVTLRPPLVATKFDADI